MNLTEFIKKDNIKNFFKEEFHKPEIVHTGTIKAEPLTENYSLVGTTFDYLLRFHLSRLNKTESGKWVAELSIEELIKKYGRKRKIEELENVIKRAKELEREFIKNGKIKDELIKHCIYLAQIDLIYRAGKIDKNMGIANEKDIEDLKNLISLVDDSVFKSKKNCLLNPGFNDLSLSADADLVIDDTLIDIKTTKYLSLSQNMFNQVIGYYLLYKKGGFGREKDINIKYLGIYFSRYGFLFKFPVSGILNLKKINFYTDFFIEEARKIK